MSAELQPLADAFAEADRARRERERAEAEAAAAAKDRAEDDASIRRAAAKGGKAAAYKFGRLYGRSRADVDALLEPTAPEAGDGEGGEGAPPAPPADPDAPPPPRKRPNPVKELPKTCPVIPLGKQAGEFYYLDGDRELRVLRKHSADDLRGLFSSRRGLDWLWDTFAKFDKNGRHNGWDPSHAAESLMTACGNRGVFDPAEMLRGPGAWSDDAGGLVLHAGDAVWVDGAWHEPGWHHAYVYPGARALPRPLEGKPDGSAATKVVALFDKWPWRWGEDAETPDHIEIVAGQVSPAALMLLGQVGCGLVGGALDWRPMVWITGDAGGGKSTLQDVIRKTYGGGLVSSSDATAAGIYQTIGYSSMAVAIDEAEADPFSPKMKHMVELVRQSASGGVILRGSSDAKVRNFTARSSFLLSSIIIPPLNAQDLTRLTLLRLGKLASVTPPRIDAAELRAAGRSFRRRILDFWPQWQERLLAWRASLGSVGHDARGCDQYGALFAMADLLLHDALADADTRGLWAETTRHLVAERTRSTNADTMLNWLLFKPIDNVFRGGQQYTIRSILRAALGYADLDGATAETCRKVLEERGIVIDTHAGFKDAGRVVVLNQHAGLAELFKGSIWGTQPGAALTGWQQAMSRLPGSAPVKKFGVRAWSVPARTFLLVDQEEEK